MRLNKLKEKIRELRLEKGKKQKEVALFLGVVESAYANYEQGRTEPNLDMLIRLAEYFGVTVDYLLGLEDY